MLQNFPLPQCDLTDIIKEEAHSSSKEALLLVSMDKCVISQHFSKWVGRPRESDIMATSIPQFNSH
jgi:hypothetical protein